MSEKQKVTAEEKVRIVLKYIKEEISMLERAKQIGVLYNEN